MKTLLSILIYLSLIPVVDAQFHGFDEGGKPYIVKSIFFRGGSYYIDEDQKIDMLNFLNEQILENYEIHIHSHTDPIGGKEYNEWLSRMRSISAYRMLEREGFLMDHIYIKDHDFTNPEFDNSTWEGRLKNRRVDIVLWPLPS